MTDLGRYILEEWTEEYREGSLGRREFLRRMVVFAGSASLGVRLVRDLGVVASPEEIAEAAAAPAPPPLRAQAPVVPPGDPALDARMVTFPGDGGPVIGYLAGPKGAPRSPGLVVIHENRGLLDHFKDVARRLAKAGYVALAPDLASPGGGTARFTDPAEVSALLGRTPPEQLVGMLNAGVRYLQSLPGVRADRTGALGFCFGGGMTWRLATRNADLKAVVPFYGSNPPLEDVPRIKAAVLAIYGGLDERVDAGIPAIRDAMIKAGIAFDMVVYPGAAHAFMNDTGSSYHADAARMAWARAQEWFKKYLAEG